MSLFEKTVKKEEVETYISMIVIIIINGIISSVIPIISIVAQFMWSNSLTFFIMMTCLIIWGTFATIGTFNVVAVIKGIKKLKSGELEGKTNEGEAE